MMVVVVVRDGVVVPSGAMYNGRLQIDGHHDAA